MNNDDHIRYLAKEEIRNQSEYIHGTICPECRLETPFTMFQTYNHMTKVCETKHRCLNCHHIIVVATRR